MIAERDAKRAILAGLAQAGFEVQRDKLYGGKWLADLVKEDGQVIILMELKFGAPVATYDISQLTMERRAVEKTTKKQVRAICLNVGDFELPADSPIFRVATAAKVEVIHASSVEDVVEKLKPLMTLNA